MVQKNMSDIIEAYLKAFLKNQAHLEIKRSDIAEHFDCVPSQINYVINTRFTQEHGYLVESKRGGGGYIRILKVQLADEVSQIDKMIELIGDQVNQRNGMTIIDTLIERQIITRREAALMASVIDRAILQTVSEEEQFTRAQLLKAFLYQLRYNYE